MSPFIPRRQIGFLLACNHVQKKGRERRKKKSNQINGTANGKKSTAWKDYAASARLKKGKRGTSQRYFRGLIRLTEWRKSTPLNESNKLTHIGVRRYIRTEYVPAQKTYDGVSHKQTEESVRNTPGRAWLNPKYEAFFFFLSLSLTDIRSYGEIKSSSAVDQCMSPPRITSISVWFFTQDDRLNRYVAQCLLFQHTVLPVIDCHGTTAPSKAREQLFYFHTAPSHQASHQMLGSTAVTLNAT